MRTSKLIGVLILALAFSALGVATASAAEKLWKFLPGSAGETFTGKSGTVTFTGSVGTIICKKSKIALANASLLEEGATEKKDATLALAIIDLEECTSAGLAINSVGDAAKQILIHVEIHTCLIKAGDFGLLFKLLQVHEEIPAAGKLLLLRGTVIGLFEGKEGTKAKTFGLKVATNAAKEQEIQKCEGGETDKLEEAVEGETFVPLTENIEGYSITFDGTKDTAGEEPMV